MRRIYSLAFALCLPLALSCYAQPLSGTYTIHPLTPTGGTNFASLQDAVNALNANGVGGPVTFELFDDGGPYTETHTFVTSNVQWAPSNAVLVMGAWTGVSAVNRVTFRAAPGEAPVFDATGKAMGVFWNGAQYVTLEGIEIHGAVFDGVSLYTEATHAQVFDAVIRRCRIHSCGGTGVTIYGNSIRPQNTLIENNFFWNLQLNNGGGFNTLARMGYVSGRRHDFSRVVHNTFYVNTAAGGSFCVIGDGASGGTGSHFAEVSNNIIVKAAAATRPIYNFPDNPVGTSGVPQILDANCYHDTSGGPFSMGSVNAADFATWMLLSGRDGNSLNTDPLLVSPATGDLHLTALSPCIDASVVPAGVLDDIDGDLRGPIPDIGADEAVACPVPEYQTNSPLASVAVNNVQGTACVPGIANLGQNQGAVVNIDSSLAGFGWEAVLAPAVPIPASAGAFATPGGQFLNVPLNVQPLLFLIGGNAPNFSTPFPGPMALPFTTPGAPVAASMAMVIFNPAHPDGAVISQAAGLLVQ